MKKILIVDINQRMIELLSLNLTTFLGAKILIARTGVNATKMMESEKLDLIVTRESIGREKTLEKVLANVEEQERGTPIICLISSRKLKKQKEVKSDIPIKYFEHGKEFENIVKAALKFAGTDDDAIYKCDIMDYYPIPIEHFYSLEKSFCDVFIKIGRETNAKFLKRILEGENLEFEAVERYLSKGVEELWIQSINRLSFVASLTEQIIKKFKAGEQDEVQNMAARQLSQELISQNIKEIGVTKEIIEVSKRSLKTLGQSVSKVKGLKSMFKKLFSNKFSYSYRLTELTTYIGMQLLEQISWAKKPQKETFIFVAFFKDISLQNNLLAKIDTEDSLESHGLNADDEELVLNHALMASELTVKFPRAPMGADQILRQHHGAINGIGFPDFASGNLSPLSLVYIISEACARYILKIDRSNFQAAELLKYLKRHYNSPRYRDYIQILEKKFTKDRPKKAQ